MISSLDNFIDFGKDVFAQNPEYRRMALDFYTTALNSEQLGEMDRVNGCSLGESIMLNLRGQIDEVNNDVSLILGLSLKMYSSRPSPPSLLPPRHYSLSHPRLGLSSSLCSTR